MVSRSIAHRRVGTATAIAFALLLLFGAVRQPAVADPSAPVVAPAATPSQTLPGDPTDPGGQRAPGPGFRPRGEGRGFGPGGGEPGRPDSSSGQSQFQS